MGVHPGCRGSRARSSSVSIPPRRGSAAQSLSSRSIRVSASSHAGTTVLGAAADDVEEAVDVFAVGEVVAVVVDAASQIRRRHPGNPAQSRSAVNEAIAVVVDHVVVLFARGRSPRPGCTAGATRCREHLGARRRPGRATRCSPLHSRRRRRGLVAAAGLVQGAGCRGSPVAHAGGVAPVAVVVVAVVAALAFVDVPSPRQRARRRRRCRAARRRRYLRCHRRCQRPHPWRRRRCRPASGSPPASSDVPAPGVPATPASSSPLPVSLAASGEGERAQANTETTMHHRTPQRRNWWIALPTPAP